MKNQFIDYLEFCEEFFTTKNDAMTLHFFKAANHEFDTVKCVTKVYNGVKYLEFKKISASPRSSKSFKYETYCVKYDIYLQFVAFAARLQIDDFAVTFNCLTNPQDVVNVALKDIEYIDLVK